jgi:hypothetical protein
MPEDAGGLRTNEPGAVLWLIPIALTLHNAEEAATFPRYLPLVQTRLPLFAQPFVARVDFAQLQVALAVATIVPFLVIAWAAFRPRSLVARWSALALQAVVALNVLSHVMVASVVLKGYSPGLVTALVVNAPLSAVLFRRAAREHWIPPWSWWLLPPTALLIHGPGLLALVLLG